VRIEKRRIKHRLTRDDLAALSLFVENAESSRDVLRAKKRLTEDEGMKETPKQKEMKKGKQKERERKIERDEAASQRGRTCVPPRAKQTQTTADLVS